MNLRPERCQYCGSNHLIPIVTGTLTGNLEQLSILGLVQPWGCFALGERMPLWACDDCGQAVAQECFLWGDGTSPQAEAYRDHVRQLFRTFKPVDDCTLAIRRGEGLLKGSIRGVFSTGFAELRVQRQAQGFALEVVGHDHSSSLIEAEYYSDEWYECMRKFVDDAHEAGNARLTVRLGRDEHGFRVEHVVLPGIDYIVVRPSANAY